DPRHLAHRAFRPGLSRRQAIWALVALAALAAAPVILPGYYLGLLTKSLILAGLSTFGHSLYFGISAYTVAFLTLKFGMTSFWLNLALAVGAAGVLSA